MAGQLISHTIPYFSDHCIPYFWSCKNGYLSDKSLSTPPTTPQKSKYLVYSKEQTHNGSRCCSLLPSMYRVFRIASFHINVERLLTRISASWWFMSNHRLDWFDIVYVHSVTSPAYNPILKPPGCKRWKTASGSYFCRIALILLRDCPFP